MAKAAARLPIRAWAPSCCDGPARRGQACYQFSTALFNGRGTAANEPAAVAWMAEACTRSDWEACSDLGWVTAHGRGVAADPAAARPILQQACDHDTASACVYLAELQRDGQGGPADAKLAAAHFAKACPAGNQDGCAGQRALGEQRAGELAQQANALDKAGRYLEILPLLEELLPLQEQRYCPAHPKVLDLMWQFGELADSQSQYARSYELFDLLLTRLRPLAEPLPLPLPLLEVVEQALSTALKLAKPEPALALVQEALALRTQQKTPADHDDWAVLRVRQAQALVLLRRPKEAAVHPSALAAGPTGAAPADPCLAAPGPGARRHPHGPPDCHRRGAADPSPRPDAAAEPVAGPGPAADQP